MSLLFSDLHLRAGESLVTFGTAKDICLFTLREQMKGKSSYEEVTVRRELEGNLEGKPVVKFRNSGAEIVISMEYIHKLAEKYPLPEVKTDDAIETAE